ncbi:MAG: metal-binding protein [Pseudonocardiales bacterium]|nr:MAG: metal-binding protein [Pseudonocardiales bacterium]
MIIPPTAAIRLRSTAVLLTMLVAVLGLVLGCGGGAGSPARGGGGPAAPSSAADTIVIKNFAFMPASLTVAPGTKITVINQDQAPHTVTASDKSFDSGTISGGQRGAVTAPTKPGSYAYICTIHQYMMGTLIVK